MKFKLISALSLCGLLSLTGCVMEESDSLQESGAEWIEVNEGVQMLSGPDGTRWNIEGIAGHEWLASELERELVESTDPAMTAYYERFLQDVENVLEEANHVPKGLVCNKKHEVEAKAEFKEVDGGVEGYVLARAKNKSGCKKTVRATAALTVGNYSEDDDYASYCKKCEEKLEYRAVRQNPSTCHADAYATVADNTRRAEVNDCP